MKLARQMGVSMCFGSDLLGALHSQQVGGAADRATQAPAPTPAPRAADWIGRPALVRGPSEAAGAPTPSSLPSQSREFLLRERAGIPPAEMIAAATTNCAELFGLYVGGGPGAGLWCRAGSTHTGPCGRAVLRTAGPQVAGRTREKTCHLTPPIARAPSIGDDGRGGAGPCG
jgi:hypothetical protein